MAENDSFIKSIAKFSISSWSNLFIGLLYVAITTRIFTPEICGELSLFNSATMILVGIVALGLDGAFARFFYEPPVGWDTKQIFTRCLLISLLFLFCLSFISLVFFYREISIKMFNKISLYLTCLLFINVFSNLVLTNFLSQYYRFQCDAKNFNVQQISTQLCSKLLCLLAVFIEPSIECVLTFNVFGMLLLAFTYIFIQRKKVFKLKLSEFWSDAIRPVYKFALFGWPAPILLQLQDFLIPFFITLLLDASALGIYASAGYFVTAFYAIQGGFRTYWAAFMYRHYGDEQEKICRIHSWIAVGIIFFLGFVIIFQNQIYMLIGEEFHGSRVFFSVVLVAPLLALWEQTTCYGTALKNRNQQRLYVYIISGVINVACTYYFLLWFGLLGVAFASLLSGSIRFLLQTWRGQVYYRSIMSVFNTIFMLALLCVLSVSNVLLYDDFFAEILVVLFIFIITAACNKAVLQDICSKARLFI